MNNIKEEHTAKKAYDIARLYRSGINYGPERREKNLELARRFYELAWVLGHPEAFDMLFELSHKIPIWCYGFYARYLISQPEKNEADELNAVRCWEHIVSRYQASSRASSDKQQYHTENKESALVYYDACIQLTNFNAFSPLSPLKGKDRGIAAKYLAYSLCAEADGLVPRRLDVYSVVSAEQTFWRASPHAKEIEGLSSELLEAVYQNHLFYRSWTIPVISEPKEENAEVLFNVLFCLTGCLGTCDLSAIGENQIEDCFRFSVLARHIKLAELLFPNTKYASGSQKIPYLCHYLSDNRARTVFDFLIAVRKSYYDLGLKHFDLHTAVEIAFQEQHVPLIRMLAEYDRTLLGIKGESGIRPVQIAVSRCDFEITELCYELYPDCAQGDVFSYIEPSYDEDLPPEQDIALRFIRNVHNSRHIGLRDFSLRPYMERALRLGALGAISLLAGYDHNLLTPDEGYSETQACPAHVAASNLNFKLLERLYWASPNPMQGHCFQLSYTQRECATGTSLVRSFEFPAGTQWQIQKFILDVITNRSIKLQDFDLKRFMLWAILHRREDIVKKLTQKAPELASRSLGINTNDMSDDTPLYLSAQVASFEIFKILCGAINPLPEDREIKFDYLDPNESIFVCEFLHNIIDDNPNYLRLFNPVQCVIFAILGKDIRLIKRLHEQNDKIFDRTLWSNYSGIHSGLSPAQIALNAAAYDILEQLLKFGDVSHGCALHIPKPKDGHSTGRAEGDAIYLFVRDAQERVANLIDLSSCLHVVSLTGSVALADWVHRRDRSLILPQAGYQDKDACPAYQAGRDFNAKYFILLHQIAPNAMQGHKLFFGEPPQQAENIKKILPFLTEVLSSKVVETSAFDLQNCMALAACANDVEAIQFLLELDPGLVTPEQGYEDKNQSPAHHAIRILGYDALKELYAASEDALQGHDFLESLLEPYHNNRNMLFSSSLLYLLSWALENNLCCVEHTAKVDQTTYPRRPISAITRMIESPWAEFEIEGVFEWLKKNRNFDFEAEQAELYHQGRKAGHRESSFNELTLINTAVKCKKFSTTLWLLQHSGIQYNKKEDYSCLKPSNLFKAAQSDDPDFPDDISVDALNLAYYVIVSRKYFPPLYPRLHGNRFEVLDEYMGYGYLRIEHLHLYPLEKEAKDGRFELLDRCEISHLDISSHQRFNRNGTVVKRWIEAIKDGLETQRYLRTVRVFLDRSEYNDAPKHWYTRCWKEMERPLLEVLLIALKRSRDTIEEVHISGMRDHEMLSYLCQVFSCCTNLKKVALTNCNLGIAHVKEVCLSLESNKQLELIDFSDNLLKTYRSRHLMGLCRLLRKIKLSAKINVAFNQMKLLSEDESFWENPGAIISQAKNKHTSFFDSNPDVGLQDCCLSTSEYNIALAVKGMHSYIVIESLDAHLQRRYTRYDLYVGEHDPRGKSHIQFEDIRKRERLEEIVSTRPHKIFACCPAWRVRNLIADLDRHIAEDIRPDYSELSVDGENCASFMVNKLREHGLYRYELCERTSNVAGQVGNWVADRVVNDRIPTKAVRPPLFQ